jgi:hypothetical protein
MEQSVLSSNRSEIHGYLVNGKLKYFKFGYNEDWEFVPIEEISEFPYRKVIVYNKIFNIEMILSLKTIYSTERDIIKTMKVINPQRYQKWSLKNCRIKYL